MPLMVTVHPTKKFCISSFHHFLFCSQEMFKLQIALLTQRNHLLAKAKHANFLNYNTSGSLISLKIEVKISSRYCNQMLTGKSCINTEISDENKTNSLLFKLLIFKANLEFINHVSNFLLAIWSCSICRCLQKCQIYGREEQSTLILSSKMSHPNTTEEFIIPLHL